MFSLRINKYWLAGLVFFLFPFFIEASCGSIINLQYEEVDWDNEDLFNDVGDFIDLPGLIEVGVPIENCENPFGVDEGATFTAKVVINDVEVKNGDTITLPKDEPVFFNLDFGNPFGDSNRVELFRKDDQDYRETPLTIGSDVFLDGLPAGDYVFVFTSEAIFLNQKSVPAWYERLRELFKPKTAHAFLYQIDHSQVVTVSFTVEHEAEEPTGASSVLFLPGIQASRLYTDGALGTENQLWVPNRDNDVEKLGMNELGESINNIYTRDVLSELFGVSNIYKGLLDLLDDLQTDGSIKDYTPFAYDWRYDVFAVATEPVAYPDDEHKLLVEEVQKLAADSYTGKVTIIGHSNGGLVAKALLHEYGDNELAGLVDKIVMVGTPQLGTPKAIGSLLHGLDQSLALGLLGTQSTARDTTQFMPGAYGLLPSRKYFENYGNDIITSDESLIAEPVSSYGDLTDYSNFTDFLVDANSTRNRITTVSQPISLQPVLLANTTANQLILDDWLPPVGTEVYEVAGTGLSTIAGFNYREFSCRENNPNCILNPLLKPVPKFTVEGDGTVVLDSAIAYEEDSLKYVVDLEQEGAGLFNKERKHSNLTESKSVETFIESVIKYPYLTDTVIATEFGDISHRYKIIAVHSPVLIVVRNSEGQEVGRISGEIKEDIIGSSYFEFAGSKYVIVPADEDVSVLLQGEAKGRYSLTIEDLSEETGQLLLQEIIGATSTSEMVAGFDCVEGVCGEVVVDYDGDGELDVRFDWFGNYQELNQEAEVIEENINVESAAGSSSGTRVGDRINRTGLVAGATTIGQDDELLELWNILLQVQLIIDNLKLYYN